MDDIPLNTLGLALAVLLAIAGFFSIAETAMMAVNRYRLKHGAERGGRGAKLALALLGRTDALLGVILLGNTLVAAGAATLTAVITKRLFGEGRARAGARHGGDLLRAARFLGNHAEGGRRDARRSHRADRELHPGADAEGRHARRVVRQPLRPGTPQAAAHQPHERIRVDADRRRSCARSCSRASISAASTARCSPICSTSKPSPSNDVMTPRNQIHALDLSAKSATLTQQLATSYHTRLPAYEDTLDNIVGVIHLKQVVHLQRDGEIDPERLRSILRPAYFVPAGTPLLAQLQQFQNDRERLGPRRRRVRRARGPRDDRGHHRGDHRRFHDAGARRERTRTGAAPMAPSSSTAWRRCAR